MAKNQKRQSDAEGKEIPLWAQLRMAYQYATPEERSHFIELSRTILARIKVKPCEDLSKGCAPSGCESTGSTGGCQPGTACLFTALQTEGCPPSGCESTGSTGGCQIGTACLFTCLQSNQG